MTITPRRPVYYLPRFDPSLSFTVGKTFRIGGRDFKPGESFDRSLASTRTMRQLYEQRKLVAVAAPAPASMPAQSAALSVRHVGHGRYRVYRGDEAVTENASREGAERDYAAMAA